MGTTSRLVWVISFFKTLAGVQSGILHLFRMNAAGSLYSHLIKLIHFFSFFSLCLVTDRLLCSTEGINEVVQLQEYDVKDNKLINVVEFIDTSYTILYCNYLPIPRNKVLALDRCEYLSGNINRQGV